MSEEIRVRSAMSRDRVQRVPVGESRTKQSFKDECDVNNVVRRYATTGMLSHVSPRQPTYGDFSVVRSFEEAIELTAQIGDQFAELPSVVRAAADNDPLRFLEMLTNQIGVQTLMDAGLKFDQAEVPASPPEGEAPGPAPEPEAQPEG